MYKESFSITLTFIAPNSTWEGNALYSDQFNSATQAILEYEPIEYIDPNGNGKYTISNVSGEGDYVGIGSYVELLPTGDVREHEIKFSLNGRAGKDIDDREQLFFNYITEATQNNLIVYKNIVKTGDKEAIVKAEENFAIAGNSFWKKYK